MGKQRRQRKKLHTPSQGAPKALEEPAPISINLPEINISSNPFENIPISFNALKKNLNDDDTRSVKSFKSIKSEIGQDKQMKKKETIKLRHQYLLQKLQFHKQMDDAKKKKDKKPAQQQQQQDFDLLMESFKPAAMEVKQERKQLTREEKTLKKMKRNRIDVGYIKVYDKVMKNRRFKANPLAAVSEHVRAIVQDDQTKQMTKKLKKKTQ